MCPPFLPLHAVARRGVSMAKIENKWIENNINTKIFNESKNILRDLLSDNAQEWF